MQNHGSAKALFTGAANNARARSFDASFAQMPPDWANWIRHAAAYGFGPAELILGGFLYTNRVSAWQ